MTHETVFYAFAILLCLVIAGFFSAAETALTAISRARIYQLVMDGNKAARIVTRLRREKESLIGTLLLANTAVNIGASALATVLAIKLFGDGSGGVAAMTVVMTMLMVIFAEVLPKTYAIQNAERVSLRLASPISLMVKLLHPVTWSVQHFIRLLFKLFGIDMTQANTLISATDVIRGTIELHHREGNMIKQDRDMLGSILDLNDVEVGDIMIHRMHVETVDADLPVEELVEHVISTMHSRIPLWRGEPDNIIGLLHVKNLIKMLGERRKNRLDSDLTTEAVLSHCSKPWFIPETTSLRDQLLAFRNQRQHFAFVVDEYGSWQGIVTLEDLIEEIVGDIEDEHDTADNDIQKSGENAYFVSGSVPVRDLNRRLDWNLPDEHASTVAGLLIHEAQRIPTVGERFNIHGFRFTVIEQDATQLIRLHIAKLPETVLPEDVEV